MVPDRVIAQRELRNDVSAVLGEVATGKRVRVTVRGVAVADLVPVSRRARFVSRARLEQMLGKARLDDAFERDVAAAMGQAIDEAHG